MEKLFLLLLSFLSLSLFAQTLSPTVISSAGGYSTGTTVTLSWTLGELATETLSTGSITLTQGFQQPSVLAGLALNVKVFMEGPFSGTQMNTNLNSIGAISLTQPYSGSPWLYAGTESVVAIPNANVVDWVLVELRDAANAASATSATRIARQAGFLLKNGTVTAVDGISTLQFNVSVSQSLFVVVWHRNHLGVMSAIPVTQTGGVYTYDFSAGAGQAYGGASGHKLLGSGIWGMIGGDGDASGQVLTPDKTTVWQPQAGTTGYKSGDYNLSGQVNNPDKNDIWRPNSGAGDQVPNSILAGGYSSQVPL
jgi:hypothetical protein